ncbi:uncharacterized protein LOC103580077 isoform X1 [Microplitis demolitor]|uniref:uncharacterized protein LOC103580077 isoform X1 n=2 Tax=Microplitis demolitor TaxID=69319 RepID=UPI0004CDBF95|nr:uncharacterized protein LOC103580077 isoform X1 [Microplitis demolitor]
MWVCRDGFNYVVRRQEKQKICFGSGKSRDLSLKSGISSFMRNHTLENFENIGPGSYNVLESFKTTTNKPCQKSFSKKGYGGLANSGYCAVHMEDYPAPNEYDVTLPRKNKFKYPFNCTSKKKDNSINKNPGPGSYQLNQPKRRILFDHDFGHCVKMRLGVEVKCTKRNTDICEVCNEKPLGDYWHLNNRVFICRACMAQERRRPRKHKKDELNNFKKIRDCSWIHSHEGTDANVWLMHPSVIRKWTQREAYMCSYVKD